MRENLSQRAREAARDLGEFTADDIGLRIAVKTYRERNNIFSMLSYLEKTGEVVSLGNGLFRYQGKQTLSFTEKIWRAMIIKGHFTHADLAKLTGATFSLVKKYTHFLCQRGFVKRVSPLGAKTTLYCLLDADSVPLEHPPLQRRK